MNETSHLLRTEMLLGAGAIERLSSVTVALFGLGGVGGFCLEALVRMGVRHLRIADFDQIKPTNLNRQLLALDSTIGRPKVDVARERMLRINPALALECHRQFVHVDTADELLAGPPDLVLDAIDSLRPKVELLRQCSNRKIPVISAMGASARTDPFKIKIDDISNTYNCPLARRVRRRLHRAGITTGITTVFSSEPPRHPGTPPEMVAGHDPAPRERRGRERRVLPSAVIIPGMFGLLMAHAAVTFLLDGAQPDGDEPGSAERTSPH